MAEDVDDSVENSFELGAFGHANMGLVRAFIYQCSGSTFSNKNHPRRLKPTNDPAPKTAAIPKSLRYVLTITTATTTTKIKYPISDILIQ